MSYQIPRAQFRVLKNAWLTFARDERRKEGETAYLPNCRNSMIACHCGKSRTSFPHWPPSTYEEAVEQLRCLIGESFPHRQYLGYCWRTYLYQKLATDREPASQQNLEKAISLVESNCEIEKYSGGDPLVRNVREVNCTAICEPILVDNSSHCLCSCRRHREECPVHRLTL